MPQAAAGPLAGPGSAPEELAATLTAIFERVLARSPVGPEEDFFELGGDSVAAVTISAELGAALGREVPITALFAAPTVAALVAALSDAAPQPFSPLVPLRPGAGAALFLVHGLGGAVGELRELAALIETARPVVGVQARGMDGTEAPLCSVEAMAESYLETIRTVQPAGPYFLGGYSFGGLVAYEMARRLAKAGEPVAFLLLIDSMIDADTLGLAVRLHFLLRRARLHGARLRTLSWAGLPGFLAARMRGLAGEFRRRRRGYLRNLGRAPEGLPEPVRRVRDACRIAGAAYRPRRYPGTLTLIVAEDRQDSANYPDIAWKRLARVVEVRAVRADHWSLVKADAAPLAAQISQALARAESGAG
ncbi:MAG: alpha/beta fold hydrolase [Acetobacteraceae bacterium]